MRNSVYSDPKSPGNADFNESGSAFHLVSEKDKFGRHTPDRTLRSTNQPLNSTTADFSLPQTPPTLANWRSRNGGRTSTGMSRSRYGMFQSAGGKNHTKSFHSSLESSKARSEYGVEEVDEVERMSQFNAEDADSDD